MSRLNKKFILRYFQSSENLLLYFFAPMVGLFVGFGAIGFGKLIDGVAFLFFHHGKGMLSFMGSYSVALLPAIGGLIVGPIIYLFAREAKGHGVPEVMASVIKNGGRIRGRVVFVKAITSALTIGSGGSAGREGPIVQIGSAIGSWLGQKMKLTEERIKLLLACGAASGVAATFNAPLAGTFFALEVILRDYGPRNISCIIISSVIATSISRSIEGDHPAFPVPLYHLTSGWDLLFYGMLGILAAVVGILFIKVLGAFEDIFDQWKFPEYFKPAIGGLIIGTIGVWHPEVFGVGYDHIKAALYGEIPVFGIVFFLVFLKIFATSITLGSGGSGGVFAPSLFIGAMLGNAYGQLTQILFPSYSLNAGASALVGMAAVFAGAAQAPVSAIIILFEMTNDYGMILPLMITCVIATVLLNQLFGDSMYTIKLKRKGIEIPHGKGLDIMEDIKISEVMFKRILTVELHKKVKEAGLKIKETGHRGFPVVDEKGKLHGIITRKDVNRALESNQGEAPLRDYMSKTLVVCYPDQSLRTALEKLGKHGIGRIPVVDRQSGDLVGLVTRKGIINGYNWALQEKEKQKLADHYSVKEP